MQETAKVYLVFNIRQLAQRLVKDPRTISSRLDRAKITPFAVTVAGEALYLSSTLDALEQHDLQEGITT